MYKCGECGWDGKLIDVIQNGGYCVKCNHAVPLNEKDKAAMMSYSQTMIEGLISDNVSRPEHYIFGPYEVRPVLLEWIKCSGIPADEAADWFSMMQYLMRYTRKGKPKRDLLKARKYLEWLIERHDGD